MLGKTPERAVNALIDTFGKDVVFDYMRELMAESRVVLDPETLEIYGPYVTRRAETVKRALDRETAVAGLNRKVVVRKMRTFER